MKDDSTGMPLKLRVDTREQSPWFFPVELAELRRGTLGAGDYALDGDEFAIERKSLADFVSTVSAQWPRFVRELDRMPARIPRVIIVEGTVEDIMERRYDGTREPKYIMHRVAMLTMMSVSVLFAGNAAMAAMLAYRIFRRRAAMIEDDL